jgi:hypothetical protein
MSHNEKPATQAATTTAPTAAAATTATTATTAPATTAPANGSGRANAKELKVPMRFKGDAASEAAFKSLIGDRVQLSGDRYFSVSYLEADPSFKGSDPLGSLWIATETLGGGSRKGIAIPCSRLPEVLAVLMDAAKPHLQ